MGEAPQDRPLSVRERWVGRFVSIRDLVWSWLTDPAVLVYRKHGFGQKRGGMICSNHHGTSARFLFDALSHVGFAGTVETRCDLIVAP